MAHLTVFDLSYTECKVRSITVFSVYSTGTYCEPILLKFVLSHFDQLKSSIISVNDTNLDKHGYLLFKSS